MKLVSYLTILLILLPYKKSVVCKLVFLPPYSPDYNPIEQAFSAIKAHLRQDCEDRSLSALDRAVHEISPLMAFGFFRASGYV